MADARTVGCLKPGCGRLLMRSGRLLMRSAMAPTEWRRCDTCRLWLDGHGPVDPATWTYMYAPYAMMPGGTCYGAAAACARPLAGLVGLRR